MIGTEETGGSSGEVDEEQEAALAVAREVLHPAIPASAASIIAATDPRLNQPSETEEELKELVESNEAAEQAAAEGDEPDQAEPPA